MLTFPDLSFLEPANLQFRIQFPRSQPPLKPSGTGSSFPAVFVWHFAQAGSHLNQTAILTGFCVQMGKTVGLSKRKQGCSRDCLFSLLTNMWKTQIWKQQGDREKSELGDWTAALVMTEETCLTAKSFQRAFIAVKEIFLFLSMRFQVLSALLFFKILSMGRHNSTDFYQFWFFMTRLAKSRQEPIHLQNLLNWCNSLLSSCCSDA